MTLPEPIKNAAWLLTMLIRSYLHPAALKDAKMTPAVLRLITDKIRLRFAQALVEPGTAVGIIAAQSYSEPLTQYMLDAHHRSASGGTSKSGMTGAREVLGAKPVAKLAAPTMLIPVLPEYSGDKARVQEIANNIEVMRFRQFVTGLQIFFEKYREIVHPQYIHDQEMLVNFAKYNPLLTPPGDLTKWCIRFMINKTNLILKNMSLELIIARLRELFPDTFIVYSPENAQHIIIRVYTRVSMFKGIITLGEVKELKTALMDTIIRGVDGITVASVVKMLRNKINEDGSVSRDDNIYGISTQGTNMQGIFSNKFVDKYRVQTSAIQETYAMLGIEAARQKAVSELRNIIDVCNHRHYLIYADEMCYTGRVTSIESSGLKTRENSNVLLRLGFTAPLSTMEDAAMNSMEDSVTGITGPLIIGSIPRIGTLYNSFHVNVEFVQANVKHADSYVNELFD